MHRIDEAVIEYAEDHWGTFPDRKVIELKGSRMYIARRLGKGTWLRLAEGALGLPGWPVSFQRSLWTAVHAAPVTALVGPLSAAALYDVTGFPRNRFELLVPHGSTNTNPIAKVRQTRHMPKAMRAQGFPVPPIERVVCELARSAGAIKLGRAIDDLLVAGKIALPRVERTFLELAVPGWPGLAVMAKVLSKRSNGYVPTRSELERVLREIVDSIDGLVVVYEKQIGDPDDMVHRVDCVIEDPVKLILEVDGRAYHQRVDDMARDRRRDRRAAALGYPTFRYLYGELMESRDTVRQEIIDFVAGGSP